MTEEKINIFLAFARCAFENEKVKKSLVGLNEFPFGSCGDASRLLGAAFTVFHSYPFQIVSAEKTYHDDNGNLIYKTHAWLENDRYLVDITVDQFEGCESYLFHVKSNEVKRHLGFNPISKHDIELGFTGIAWNSFYTTLKDLIQQT